MINTIDVHKSKEWLCFLNSSLDSLLAMEPIAFRDIKPIVLPKSAGVYLISETREGVEYVLYVGRTKNFKQRIYTNHLMGAVNTARLKKYIINDKSHSCYGNVKSAKQYIRDNCYVRWICIEDMRQRGVIEGYFTAMFFPTYGIAEEH
jgi:uncharacterized SAM-binding protein YcdF (DUF218 family)